MNIVLPAKLPSKALFEFKFISIINVYLYIWHDHL